MNLAYPKGLEKTFTFVQNILLGYKNILGWTERRTEAKQYTPSGGAGG
jgi:hypothetical protein